DHLSAFVFHRVLSLDTPSEKEKKLCSSFSENLCVSPLLESDPGFRRWMPFLYNTAHGLT
ncbi:MAG: hypothetical protein J5773_05190, partial [Verrucomicrobia bacterium]|nr:hypothetical protein [Verrucomicrobiota bacterium]